MALLRVIRKMLWLAAKIRNVTVSSSCIWCQRTNWKLTLSNYMKWPLKGNLFFIEVIQSTTLIKFNNQKKISRASSSNDMTTSSADYSSNFSMDSSVNALMHNFPKACVSSFFKFKSSKTNWAMNLKVTSRLWSSSARNLHSSISTSCTRASNQWSTSCTASISYC